MGPPIFMGVSSRDTQALESLQSYRKFGICQRWGDETDSLLNNDISRKGISVSDSLSETADKEKNLG